jgi:CubicO group peptidase (beta-lactamase class C family)
MRLLLPIGLVLGLGSAPDAAANPDARGGSAGVGCDADEARAAWRENDGLDRRDDGANSRLRAGAEEPFSARTRVSLRGRRWYINDKPTNTGTRAEGLLMNVRMVNAVFEDGHKPDLDPAAITDRFLVHVPDYAAHGVNAFTLCLQGGMPGYEGALNSAFEPDGSVREPYLDRVARVIEACDRVGLVVILGCFYQRQDQVLADEAAVRAAVLNVVDWLKGRGYRNVVLEVANEFDHDGFNRRLIRTVEGEIELIRLAKTAAPELLVSTSGLGHGRYPDALAEAADFLLIHFNGTPLSEIPARIESLKRFAKPIVCNEDPKAGEAGAKAAELCVANGASWGFMTEKINQHHPFSFDGAKDDSIVYAKLKELTSPRTRPEPSARTYFPPPESEGGWRKLDDPESIRRQAGMDPDRLKELRAWLRQSDDRSFAAVVIRRGYIVLEEERDNSAASDSRRVASCSKAICATVLAIASEQSQLGRTPGRMSFDDTAFDFIPWAQPLSDPRKAKITVKQLLNHTSGLCPEATGAPNDGTWEYILGHSGDARTERLAFDPGTACGYSTHALAHAALVCETVTGQPYDKFAIEALFKPLGIEHWSFQYYEGGPKIGRHPSHGLGMPAREMARIAYCMARRGRWDGKQVIPKWFVEQTAAPTHDVRGPELRFKVNAQIFSHGWELPARMTGEVGRSGRGIPPDARSKPGSGGQLIAFVPSLDLVITRQTGSSGGWEYEEFLRRACAVVVDAAGQEPKPNPPADTNRGEGKVAPNPGARNEEATAGTVFGLRDTRFTLNGEPRFLLGISYYGGLGAPEELVRRDLDDLKRHGFNWLRVWATWSAFDRDVSAVDGDGRPREPFLGRLKWLVAECDQRGLVVDVTLTRGDRANGGAIPNLEAHRRAVETLVGTLKEHHNWYLDLANERDVRDARHVPAEELKALREQVRRLDPERLVTASFGGHDLDEADLRDALLTIGVDFVAPHRPRDAGSASQTEAKTRTCLATMRAIGRAVPVHYQEPFRRGYGRWEPTASDFLTDLRGAVVGGAAGWCFHNGSRRGEPEDRPRRSFDLHAWRLFDQLDEEEREVVARAAAETHRGQARSDLDFLQHFVSHDLPSDRGQGDYGLTAPADLDRAGDLDVVSKPWSASPGNGAGGKIDVDYLGHRTRP